VIWRSEETRCELWSLSGASLLRVYDGDGLILEEPFIRAEGWARAVALRARYRQLKPTTSI